MIKPSINENENMKLLLKEMFLYFHFVLLAVLAVNTVCFYLQDSEFYFRLFLMFILYDLFITFVIIKMPYDLLRPFVMPYLIAVYFFLLYFILCIWRSNPAVLVIFAVIPFGVNTIFSKKIVTLWWLAVICSTFITLLVPKNIFSVYHYITNYNYENIKLIISLLIIFAFVFYYNNKIVRANYKTEHFQEKDLQTDSKSKEMYENLYKQILNYFESETPWKDPDFGILELAAKLHTNNTYISRAVNNSSGMNFKTFINKYRIDYVKSELLSDKVKKRYTLLYIYTSAGFKHQSTFNKAFKQIENMTPSEYISMINSNNIELSAAANI